MVHTTKCLGTVSSSRSTVILDCAFSMIYLYILLTSVNLITCTWDCILIECRLYIEYGHTGLPMSIICFAGLKVKLGFKPAQKTKKGNESFEKFKNVWNKIVFLCKQCYFMQRAIKKEVLCIKQKYTECMVGELKLIHIQIIWFGNCVTLQNLGLSTYPMQSKSVPLKSIRAFSS